MHCKCDLNFFFSLDNSLRVTSEDIAGLYFPPRGRSFTKSHYGSWFHMHGPKFVLRVVLTFESVDEIQRC